MGKEIIRAGELLQIFGSSAKFCECVGDGPDLVKGTGVIGFAEIVSLF